MRLALTVPLGNTRGPLYADQALAAIHAALGHRGRVCFEIGSHDGTAGLFVDVPDDLRRTVESHLLAHYPDAKFAPTGTDPSDSTEITWSQSVRLVPDLFPIRRYTQFEDALNRTTADPLTPLLSAVARRSPSDPVVSVVFEVTPAHHRTRHRAERCLHRLATPFFRAHPRLARRYARLALSPSRMIRVLAGLIARVVTRGHQRGDPGPTTSVGRVHEREDPHSSASDKLSRPLFVCRLTFRVRAAADREEKVPGKLRELAGALGPFGSHALAGFCVGRMRRSRRERPLRRDTFLLSAEELATLWHPPTETVRTPTLGVVQSRDLEPPVHLPGRANGVAVLGLTSFRGTRRPVGIRPDDRLRHVTVLGKTGMGKSTLLHHLIATDIAAGRGVGLIDPHGDLADAVLRTIPARRTNDVVLFDAADADWPVAFNPLHCPTPAQRPLVASGVLAAFKKLYGDSWGPRLEHVFRNALLSLLELPDPTLLLVVRLLADERFRRTVVERLTDPVVRSFWVDEFAAMPPKFRAEVVSPVLNKVGSFVTSPLLRNLLGQRRNKLDLRAVMDDGKVLVANLSKGRLGDDASALLGSLLVSGLQLAAMGRAELPERQRRPFFLYVDEFQNFATESFAVILSESRKYRLGTVLSHQFLAQLGDATRAAVMGNVGTLVAFQVGTDDAEGVAAWLGADVQETDLLQLPRYRAYARVLIDGVPSRPFSIETLPPNSLKHDPVRADAIRRTARRRYARPRVQVEAAITSQYGTVRDPVAPEGTGRARSSGSPTSG